ncbi:MAG: hypothetical protein Q8Q46_01405 [Candidatus Giovannonibacteria bacterium]|nr:hypothetical protein [Candidatus Giovannonibacteria bacterium]
MTKRDWEFLEKMPGRLDSVIKSLELVSFLKDRENQIGGEEMLCRARFEFGTNYGQEDADWFIEHQEKIPKEFRPFFLVFAGSDCMTSWGWRHVACLSFESGLWVLGLKGLNEYFYSPCRLVRNRR